jgi:hypothetical protein
MSILDDAIREHLELKRAHGADESELKKLEDEAFGPPARPEEPDPFAEAPTEFLTAPGEDADEAADAGEGGGRRVPNIADLQEAPPAPSEPSIEEQPAMEHEAISDPAPGAEQEANLHTTDEREAIADQPTEFFDVAADLESSSEAVSPSDEDLVEAGISEPRLAPVDPLSGIEASAAEPEAAEEELEDEEDFFSDQRLSEELDNALEAPITDEHPAPITDEHPAPPPATPTEEGTAVFDAEEEEELEDEEEAELEEPESDEHPVAAAEPESSESAEPNVFEPETGSHDDVLEDTPDFLEDAPEDDDLWFEQRPPKDFDFDD